MTVRNGLLGAGNPPPPELDSQLAILIKRPNIAQQQAQELRDERGNYFGLPVEYQRGKTCSFKGGHSLLTVRPS